MKRWSVEDNIWLRRVSILHQLAFKEQTDPSLLRTVLLNNLEDSEFFIQKAIGWALREYAKTDESWVRHFVKEFENDLSSLSQREALKNLTD
jgi:3-methyladenine DNA glycosylase AlkD